VSGIEIARSLESEPIRDRGEVDLVFGSIESQLSGKRSAVHPKRNYVGFELVAAPPTFECCLHGIVGLGSATVVDREVEVDYPEIG